MSWLNKLYETYENCSSLIGESSADEKTPLLPIAHSTQNAQIQITIDDNGNYMSAAIVGKNEAVTIIPVTEDSGSRSSGISPHPLFDKLPYIAGDYNKYVVNDKEECFAKYISQLEKWCNSEYGNTRVKAILAYVKKQSIISDLLESKLLQLDETGKLDPIVKVEGISQCDVFVRINVKTPGLAEEPVWKDKAVWDSFISHYLSLQESKDLCYGTGKIIPTSDKHPSKIRNSGDKAKLISGNDSTGFTYRGRFTSKNQAISVGYETSQKAHNALKWLIDKQGYSNYDEVVVAWGTRNQNIPSIMIDTLDLFPEETKSEPPTTYEGLAKQLSSAIAGYGKELNVSSETVVMGLEAATPGRLSITYYRELPGSDLLERINHWHRSCIWRHSYRFISDGLDEKGKTTFKRVTFVGAPSPKDIAHAAFGAKAPDKLIKSTIHRLLSCIIDKASLPYDIVKASVNRTLKPTSMEDEEQWEKVRSITCALVKKYREDKYVKEVWPMELDQSKQDINYLLGRLLAVADEIEKYALKEKDKESKEKRPTNAIRYFERFSQHPEKTWKIINNRLVPYRIELGSKADWLNSIIEDISSMIDPDEFKKARNLDGRFILGFDCQKKFIKDEIIRKNEAKKASNNTQILSLEEDN